MATVTLQGNEFHTSSELPAIGSAAPEFNLVNGELGDVKLADYQGKKVIMNIVPSLDTPTCATSTRTFNQQAAGKGKKGAAGDGCDVHQKLARLLYEEPVVKAKGNNPAKQGSRGAARALEDHQYAYAIDLLTQLESSVDSSVVHPDFGTLIDKWNYDRVGDADYWAAKVRDFATAMKARIDPVAGCY